MLERVAELRTELPLVGADAATKKGVELARHKLWTFYRAGYYAYTGEVDRWESMIKAPRVKAVEYILFAFRTSAAVSLRLELEDSLPVVLHAYDDPAQSGLDLSLVVCTNAMIACLAAPSFHDGSGSVVWVAKLLQAEETTAEPKTNTKRMNLFISFST